jgi:hypothetical protein
MASVCSYSNHSQSHSVLTGGGPAYTLGTYSVDDSFSTESVSKRRVKRENPYVDKEFQRVTREIVMGDNTTKRVRIEYYHTRFQIGRDIRNAVSGMREVGMKVGSRDEDLFFKVTMATGENGNREPHFLYYDNPEQWERHFYTTYPIEKKTEWLERYNLALQRKIQLTKK